MNSSYEKLRYSFDNILKELDDICKSIDDLNDIEEGNYVNRVVNANNSETNIDEYDQSSSSNQVTTSLNEQNFSQKAPILTSTKSQLYNLEYLNNYNNDFNQNRLQPAPSSIKKTTNSNLNYQTKDLGSNKIKTNFHIQKLIEYHTNLTNGPSNSNSNSTSNKTNNQAYEKFKKSFYFNDLTKTDEIDKKTVDQRPPPPPPYYPRRTSNKYYTNVSELNSNDQNESAGLVHGKRPSTNRNAKLNYFFAKSFDEDDLKVLDDDDIISLKSSKNVNKNNDIEYYENESNDEIFNYNNAQKNNIYIPLVQLNSNNQQDASISQNKDAIDENELNNQQNLAHFNEIKPRKKRHLLPDDEKNTPRLNNVVGSVHDALFFSFDKQKYSFPIATTNNINSISSNNQKNNNNNNYLEKNNIKYQNSNQESTLVKPSISIKNKRTNLISLNQQSVSFSSSTTNSNENLDSSNNELTNPIRESTTKYNGDFFEQDDYLSSSEISKIECFYNSMGCYVYVSRCVAELYQIKREDEFDAVDIDPVNDYYIYMQHKRRESLKLKASNSNDDNNINNDEDLENLMMENNASTTTPPYLESKSRVNYMYINSGVPVIVFNYGANPKRKKDLRVLLAERSTGFCMFDFKFDGMTKFENANEMTVCRLTFNDVAKNINSKNESNLNESTSNSASNNENVNKSLFGFTSAISSLTSKVTSQQQNFYSFNPTSSTGNTFNYHNEYFERLFNSKRRHAHKEHLLKFVIKRDCDDFYFQLNKIMSDRRNADLFILKRNDYFLKCSLNGVGNSSKSSSVIQLNHLFENDDKVNQKRYSSNISLNSSTTTNYFYNNNLGHANNSSHRFTHRRQGSSVTICHFDFLIYNDNVNENKSNKPNELKPLYKNPSMSSLSIDLQDNASVISNTYQNKKSSIKPTKSNLSKKYSNSSSTILSQFDTVTNLRSLNRNNSFISNMTQDENGNSIFENYSDYNTNSNNLNGITNSKVKNPSINGSIGTTSSAYFFNDSFGANKKPLVLKDSLLKSKKLKKSDISNPVNFNHVTHLDKPVAIGRRYKLNY